MFNWLGNDSLGKLVLRLSVGILMLFHGVNKLINHPGSIEGIGGMLTGQGLPVELAYGVYLGEIIAPLMVIFGFLTRLGGLIIFVNMIFAIWLVHLGQLFGLTENGGYELELQALFLFGGLAIMLLGSGRFALKPDSVPAPSH